MTNDDGKLRFHLDLDQDEPETEDIDTKPLQNARPQSPPSTAPDMRHLTGPRSETGRK